MRNLALVIILVMLFLPVSVSATETPTPTPSLSPTPTLSNSERIAIGTIAPPRTCGTNFVPCGPLPFRPPRFPTIVLPSPTMIDLSAYQPLPTNTPDPLATPTPPEVTATIADVSSVGTLSYSAGVIGATLSAQRTLVLEVGGTPIGIPQLMEGLGSNIAQPFAFLRGVQENYANLGIVSNFLTFGFYALVFIVFIRMAIIGIPFVVWLIRLILEIIRTIKP